MYLQLQLVAIHIQFKFGFFHVIWLYDRVGIVEREIQVSLYFIKMHLSLFNVIISCYPTNIR